MFHIYNVRLLKHSLMNENKEKENKQFIFPLQNGWLKMRMARHVYNSNNQQPIQHSSPRSKTESKVVVTFISLGWSLSDLEDALQVTWDLGNHSRDP